jgi:hypothetical protein
MLDMQPGLLAQAGRVQNRDDRQTDNKDGNKP